ncbi:MAG: hypothetical protein U0X20_29315 [Caldilineaceae bacterium]
MNIRNGVGSLANRPVVYWSLIGAGVVGALVGGYAIGSAFFGTPAEAQAAAMAARPLNTCCGSSSPPPCPPPRSHRPRHRQYRFSSSGSH